MSLGERLEFDRNGFLSAYFQSDFDNPNPRWKEVVTVDAFWIVVGILDVTRKVIAVRTTETGTINSFCIDLDYPNDFAHVQTDGELTFYNAVEDVQAQTDLGLTAVNSEDDTLFNELVDALRLEEAIG